MSDPTSESPTPEERAWSEYLAWTRGADAEQYEETEQRAWRRLQRERLQEIIFTADEGFDIVFTQDVE